MRGRCVSTALAPCFERSLRCSLAGSFAAPLESTR